MTSEGFNLYGLIASSLEEAQAEVGRVLAIDFVLHDSLYRGGDYYLWRGAGSAEIVLQRNFPDEDGMLAEPDYPSYPFVLYVSDVDAAALGRLAKSGIAALLAN